MARIPSYRLIRFGLFLSLICWAMIAGKDVSWDVLNHQFYLPFSWIHGRYSTDLLGAGPQSYQNPFGYFPVYALVWLGLPAWLIGIVLSASHALMVWPLDRIARLFWPSRSDEDFWFRILALTLCCLAPVFLIHDGTTSIDPFTSLMVIWAVALTLPPAANARKWHGTALAGACLGLASALKLSNAIFAMAIAALWLFKWALKQTDWRRLLSFFVALVATFALAAGPWMWVLWREFGNPIFPLYNNVFHSPYAPQQAITALRFVPTGLMGAVSRLWEMGELSSYVSFEAFLPDIRPLVAALALLGAAVTVAGRGGWRFIATRGAWTSVGVQFVLFMIFSYALWIRSSGNARYGLPVFVLLGLFLARCVQKALPYSLAKILLLTTLLLQGAFYFSEGEYRFRGTNWDAGPYIDYRVPARLRDQPFLHVVIGSLTASTAALFLHPNGALTNPIGQMAIPTDGALGERFKTLLSQWRGRTRLLFAAPGVSNPADVDHAHKGLHDLLYRLGLDVDWSDCEVIEIDVSLKDSLAASTPGSARPSPSRRLLSCAVIYRPERNPFVESQRLQAELVFAIMEKACPRLFSPTPLASEHGANAWQRHYMNTEAELTVSPTDGVHFSHFRQVQGVNFGSIEDVLNHRLPISCPQIDYQTPM